MKKVKRNKIKTKEQKVLKSMIKENPNIKTLVNSFNLQIDKTIQYEHTTDIR